MIDRGLNAPETTSAGRLFDAVAALLGLCAVARFEGEAATRLEYAARAAHDAAVYPFPLVTEREPWRLDWGPLVEAVLAERSRGVATAVIARRFHNTLAAAVVAMARRAGHARVCLSGGCFQNRCLTEAVLAGLAAAGLRGYLHRQVPPNDGGIALGQVVVAAARWNPTEAR